MMRQHHSAIYFKIDMIGIVRLISIAACAVTLVQVSAQPQRLLKYEDFIETCRKVKREEIEPCIMDLINSGQSNYEVGIPELDVPAADDAIIPYMNFSDYQNENSYFNAEFFDSRFKGLSEIKLIKLKVDYDNHFVDWVATAPELTIYGKYKLDANLLLVPLQGQGTFWGRMSKPTLTARTKIDLEKYDGDYHIKAKDSTLDVDFESASAKFNNLYQENALLREAANTFINQNAKELIQEILPAVRDQLLVIIFNMAQGFSRKIPLTMLTGEEYLRKAFNVYD